jgi:hypothetical protein
MSWDSCFDVVRWPNRSVRRRGFVESRFIRCTLRAMHEARSWVACLAELLAPSCCSQNEGMPIVFPGSEFLGRFQPSISRVKAVARGPSCDRPRAGDRSSRPSGHRDQRRREDRSQSLQSLIGRIRPAAPSLNPTLHPFDGHGVVDGARIRKRWNLHRLSCVHDIRHISCRSGQ